MVARELLSLDDPLRLNRNLRGSPLVGVESWRCFWLILLVHLWKLVHGTGIVVLDPLEDIHPIL